jgi:two-component system, LytTR family, response regulator
MNPATSLRVLVVDDELVAREGVRRMLEDDPEVTEVRTCAGATDALQELAAGGFDLMLVDVQMPGMSGLELIEAHGQERAPVTVFLTAYDQYAIQAFEAGAIDYLLKPFSDERFRRAIERAKRQVEQQRLARTAEPGTARRSVPPLDRLIVRTGGTLTLIPVGEIDWIEAADYYAIVHVGGAEHLVRVSLRHLERGLPPDTFIRIHRRAIVRVERIRSVRGDHAGAVEVELLDGTRLPVSRRLRERLRVRLLERR